MESSTMPIHHYREYGMDLADKEILCMYSLKKNGVDSGRAYILSLIRHGLYLKLSNSTYGWENNLYIK